MQTYIEERIKHLNQTSGLILQTYKGHKRLVNFPVRWKLCKKQGQKVVHKNVS